jgi:hypothetical protein
VKDLDREVLARLAQDLLRFLLDDLPGPVMGIDDVVTDREINALRFAGDLQVVVDLLGSCLGGDGVLLNQGANVAPCCSCLQIAVHEVDLL